MPEIQPVNFTTGTVRGTSLSCKSDFRTGSSNSVGHALRRIEANRLLRHAQFPSLKDNYSCHSFTGNLDINSDSLKKNFDKDKQPVAPHRIYDSLVDPTSGFLSTGCHDWRSQITSTVFLDYTPLSMPKDQIGTSSTLDPINQFQLKRPSTCCPGFPFAWNSRKTSDAWIQAQIAGLPDDATTRRLLDIQSFSKAALMREQGQGIQDRLALRYKYGTSTQRGYEDVPWDIILRPKQWPPKLVGHHGSEMLLYHRNKKLCETIKQECQAADYSCDQALPASKHSAQGTATREPPAEHHFDYRRSSRMSKMVTLVPPYNPFNAVKKVPVRVEKVPVRVEKVPE